MHKSFFILVVVFLLSGCSKSGKKLESDPPAIAKVKEERTTAKPKDAPPIDPGKVASGLDHQP